jgi:uncharacterized DUF497 family protein
MPVHRFIWTDVGQAKVEANGVTLDEFEAVVQKPLRTVRSRTTGRPIAIGIGDDGRLLACVYEQLDQWDVLPVTAYEVADG